MQFCGVCILSLIAVTGAVDNAATPVQKVIDLLNGMLEKGQLDKEAEQKQFMTYKTFCEDVTASKMEAINKANDHIELLKAEIAKAAEDAARLTEEITAHEGDIAVWTGDQKAATKVRAMDKEDYDALHADYSESIDAILRATEVLKKQQYDRKQAESFVQVANLKKFELIPAETKRVIDAYLQQQQQPEPERAAPEANAYEFQSGAVIDTLMGLHDKFVEERTALEKSEQKSRHSFEMLMQSLTQQIAEAQEDVTRKTLVKAKRLQYKADSEGDLTDTTTTRDADVEYRTDLVATCEQKAADYESRRQLRVEELEAIQKAVEIIKSSSVKGHAETYLPAMLQTRKKTALVQMGSEESPEVKQRVVDYLQRRATALSSRLLAALAQRAAADPFAKVKKLIKDLIVRLMNEATAETEHKAWCDQELATNEKTREEKTVKVEQLHAQIDELKTSIAKISEDIAALNAAVAELDAAMSEATKLRNEERAKNGQTIADAKEAQTAVANALAVLNEFYAKAGEATALVQRRQQPVPPPIFDAPYKGMQAEHGGVIGMLEVIQSDFARLEANTEAAEKSAQTEYQGFMNDSQVDKAAKVRDSEHKAAKVEAEKRTLTTAEADLLSTQRELTAAIAYFDKLKPTCVNSGASYESRVERRQEEIESLKEALWILNSNSMGAEKLRGD